MKKLLFLLLIPILLFGQYDAKRLIPFLYPDTLKQADTITGGWLFVGNHIGAETFGIILDTDSGIDSLVAITLQAKVNLDDFKNAPGSVFDDSVYAAADSTGWMNVGTIDSICIADSTAWLKPMSSLSWWNYVSWIKYRLISPATNDTCFIIKSVQLGQ